MSTHPTMRARAALLAPLVVAAVVGGATTAGAAPAGGDPPQVVVGLESTHAALVRIETTVKATAIFIDHSTGDVVLQRWASDVLQGSATGVVTAADGVVATLNRELTLNESRVRPEAVNQLFVNQFKAQLVDGNGSTQRTHATDPEVDRHLQACYDLSEVCVVYGFPQYTVIPQSADQHRTPATVLNSPSGPADVALLRIGGSALPTAELADSAAATEKALVTGLDRGPADGGAPRDWAPADVAVGFDGQSLQAAADVDLAGRLQAGLTGGPLIDATEGQVLGLVDWDPASSTAAVVGVDALRAALDQSGLRADRSPFNVAFERGLQLLGDGDYTAAHSELDKAIAYFDSLPAERFRQTADDRAGPGAAGTRDPSAEPAADDSAPWLWIGIAVAVLVLGGLLVLWLVRRRGSPPPEAEESGFPPDHPAPTEDAAATGGESWPSQPLEPSLPRGLGVPASLGPPDDVPPGQAAAPSVVMTHDRPPVPSAPGIGPAAHDIAPARTSDPGTSPRQAFCIRCGSRLVLDGAFCGGCGAPVRHT